MFHTFHTFQRYGTRKAALEDDVPHVPYLPHLYGRTRTHIRARVALGVERMEGMEVWLQKMIWRFHTLVPYVERYGT